jgi:hypothetical protein
VHRFRYLVRSTDDTRGGNEDLGSFNVEVHERGIDRANSDIVQHILENAKRLRREESWRLTKHGFFPKEFRLRPGLQPRELPC